MIWLVAIAVAWCIVPAVFGIVAIRAALQLRPTQPSPCVETEIPEDIRNELSPIVNTLQAIGFEFIGWLQSEEENSSGTVESYLATLHHPETWAVCVPYITLNRPQNGVDSRSMTIDFANRFANNHRAITSSSQISIFPRQWSPDRTGLRLPGTRRADSLYLIHLKLCSWIEAQYGTVRQADLDSNAGAAEVAHLIHQDSRTLYENFSTLGYLRRGKGSTDDSFRPTWKGAIGLTLRQIEPWKSFVNTQEANHYRSLLQKIDR